MASQEEAKGVKFSYSWYDNLLFQIIKIGINSLTTGRFCKFKCEFFKHILVSGTVGQRVIVD